MDGILFARWAARFGWDSWGLRPSIKWSRGRWKLNLHEWTRDRARIRLGEWGMGMVMRGVRS